MQVLHAIRRELRHHPPLRGYNTNLIMKSFTFAIALLTPFLTCAATDSQPGYLPLRQNTDPSISDLALVYQGGDQRPAWTTNRFAPYVTYTDPKSGREQWLYDGFLFIEFVDGHHHTFEKLQNVEPAQKPHWLRLLNKNFGVDGIPRLDQTCQDAAKRIGPPSRKRQVILTLPVPIAGQTNWGQIDARDMNFNVVGDQTLACHWYIETALEKWRALAPKELNLAGFYWLQEGAGTNAGFLAFINAVASDVHQHGKKFYWIPYWHARGAGNWREYGFDAAWQQPNYFFHPTVPISRLQDACDFARRRNMGLEMELDDRALTQTEVFEPRLHDYLAAYISNGVKASAAIAWYEGGGALYELASSKRPEFRRDYDEIAQFVLSRQHKADDEAK